MKYILEKHLRNNPDKDFELEFNIHEDEKRFMYRMLSIGEKINDIYQAINLRKQMPIPPKHNDRKIYNMVCELNDAMKTMVTDSVKNKEITRYLQFLNNRMYEEGTLLDSLKEGEEKKC